MPVTTADLSAVIQTTIQRLLVTPLETASSFLASGPRIFDTASPISIPRLTGSFSPDWVGESELITEDDGAGFDAVGLLPSTMRSVKTLIRLSMSPYASPRSAWTARARPAYQTAYLGMLGIAREEPVHRARAAGEHRPQLLAIDQFGHSGVGVPDQVRDVLDRDAGAGQKRHKRVPQLARCPPAGVEARRRRHPAAGAAHVRRVQLGAGAGREHKIQPVYDMIGNVWEWCSTNTTPGRYELKGSAFTSPLFRGEPAAWNDANNFMQDDDTGFRCAYSLDQMASKAAQP